MAAKKTNSAKRVASVKSVIAEVCAELKVVPRIARRRLRAAGMKAPYADASAVRKALAKHDGSTAS